MTRRQYVPGVGLDLEMRRERPGTLQGQDLAQEGLSRPEMLEFAQEYRHMKVYAPLTVAGLPARGLDGPADVLIPNEFLPVALHDLVQVHAVIEFAQCRDGIRRDRWNPQSGSDLELRAQPRMGRGFRPSLQAP